MRGRPQSATKWSTHDEAEAGVPDGTQRLANYVQLDSSEPLSRVDCGLRRGGLDGSASDGGLAAGAGDGSRLGVPPCLRAYREFEGATGTGARVAKRIQLGRHGPTIVTAPASRGHWKDSGNRPSTPRRSKRASLYRIPCDLNTAPSKPRSLIRAQESAPQRMLESDVRARRHPHAAVAAGSAARGGACSGG